MIRSKFFLLIPVLICMAFILPGNTEDTAPVKVVVITGGHEFERDEFFSMFQSGEIQYTEWEQPVANQNVADGKALAFDVMVLYDLWQDITEEEKEGYLKYLKSGKSIVALHHCIGSYQTWDEFVRIIGGTYIMSEKPRTIAGKSYPPSNYKHDVNIAVSIADSNHPVTAGISDFNLFDEVYGNYHVLENVHVLLKTNHPESTPVIGWINRYSNANIVYLQSGHGPSGFENQNFIKLVRQAVGWVAKEK